MRKLSSGAAVLVRVTFPGNGNKSDASALEIARNNGYNASVISKFGPGESCSLGETQTIRICTGPGDLPTQYKVTVVTGRPMKNVEPFWVRANGCGAQVSYAVLGDGGPGSTYSRFYDWKVPFDGRIVSSRSDDEIGLPRRQ